MNRTSWKAEFKPLLGPILFPLIFFFSELVGRTVFAGFDFTHIILPLQQYARESLLNGTLPHWNPYMFAGFPQIAEGEGGLFYPGNLLLWLPGDQAVLMSWTVVIHFIITGCLMYAFLRGRGASRVTSSIFAVLFQMLPGTILHTHTVGLFQATAWLPGFYWALERSIAEAADANRRKWLSWTLFAGIQIAFMFLAGSSQIAFYAMVGAVFYLFGLIMMGPKPSTRAVWSAIGFILIGITGAILSAVQVLPTSILAPISYRMQEAGIEYFQIGTWLNLPRLASIFVFPAIQKPSDLLNYVSSIGYIGMLPTLFIAVTLSMHRRNMNPILPPFFLAFFGLILSFGLNIAFNMDLLTFPGFGYFRAMGRMILPVVVALIAFAAAGLDWLIVYMKTKEIGRQVNSGIVGGIIISLIILAWFLFYEGLPPGGFIITGLIALAVAGLFIAIALSGFIITRKRAWLAVLTMVWLVLQLGMILPLRAILTMDHAAYNRAYAKFRLGGQVESQHPNRPARVLIANDMEVWKPLMERLRENPLASGNSLPLCAYGDELNMGGIGVLNAYTPLITNRWQTAATDYAAKGLDEVHEASGRLRIFLALMQVDAIIAPDEFYGGSDFTELDIDTEGIFPPDWHILKSPEWNVPYIGAAKYAEAWTDSDFELFKHWVLQDGYVPGDWAVVEVDRNFPLPDGMSWGEVENPVVNIDENLPAWGAMEIPGEMPLIFIPAVRRDGAIMAQTASEAPFWMIVRESYMEGWTAKIDGVPAQIAPADYLFIGIPVPSGEHTVELTYTTPKLREGAIISGIGWLVCLMVLGITLIRRKGQPRASA